MPVQSRPSQRVAPPPKSSSSGGVIASSSPILSPPPTSPYSKPYLIILLSTVLIATIYSIATQSPYIQSFRSRLPASSISSAQATDFLPPRSLPYFADKRNLFNQYFVKLGWGWTTLAWTLVVFTTAIFPPKKRTNAGARQGGDIDLSNSTFLLIFTHFRRFFLASTIWWYLTQSTWFFGIYNGPSISHHLLVATGAQCVPSAIGSQTLSNIAGELVQPVCTGAGKGEYWKGGHDVSGHVFMMIHASLLLLETIAPYLPLIFTFLTPYPIITYNPTDGTSTITRPTSYNSNTHLPFPTKVAIYATMALMALWWWMMLMTSTFFHTPAEKISGALFGVAGWWISSGMW